VESTPTLRDLFEELLGLDAAGRERVFAAHGVDAETRAQMERMLAADATRDDPFPAGDAASVARAIGETEIPEALPAGSRIGPFEIVEVLGEGGSSTVFRAFREVEGVRQDVAVKLLARGLYTPEAQRQFRREREALARLRHRSIARLIEGGIADNGLAYIALELVDGQPITRHAREHDLPERDRLVLFLEVCRAVESAHRALIVHRDLKPSNVLVTRDGEVKLLDFGIAKLLDYAEEATRTFHQALTPAYAAPEQFDTGEITTATDVYALGVLLGELLTGERKSGRTRTRDGDGSARWTSRDVARRLRGDLANIVGKATAAEPENRYASAGALADDIERYLDGEPVLAHPPSRWYRTEKFIARHRGGVVVITVLLLAIFVSLAAALWQAHVARREAQRADAIRDFVVGLLRQTAPDVPASQRPDVPTLVYAATRRLPQELRDQPETRAQLLYTLGNVLHDMGDLPHSEALLRDAEKSAARLPPTSSTRIQTQIGLIRTLLREGRYDEATRRIVPLLAIPASQLPGDVSRAELLKLGMVIADGYADTGLAVSRGREMLKEYRADCAAGRNCDDLSSATHDLASVLLDADRIAESQVLADETLRLRSGSKDATPMDLANAYELESKIALYRGDLAAADADARKSAALLDSLGNSLHRKPLEPQAQRIEALLDEENAREADALAATLLAEQRSRKASRCSIAWTEIQQARAALLLGNRAGAAAVSQSAIGDGAACRRKIVRDVTVTLAELARARALAALGDKAGAEALYARTSPRSALMHADDPLSWPQFLSQSMRLAAALGHSGAAADDARLLLAALDRANALPTHPWRLEAQLLLAGQAPAHDPATFDARAFDAALAKIRAWPVGVRLAALRADNHVR
jgi:serine/threonine-protein kinase